MPQHRHGTMPPAGDPPGAPPGEPVTPESVRADVDDVLRMILDCDVIYHDDDGDVPIRMGDAMVFVRVCADEPVVQVLAPVVWAIPATADVFAVLNRINVNTHFVHVSYDDETVTASVDLPVFPVEAAHLERTLTLVADVVHRHARLLQDRWGGCIPFGDELPPRQLVPGYL